MANSPRRTTSTLKAKQPARRTTTRTARASSTTPQKPRKASTPVKRKNPAKKPVDRDSYKARIEAMRALYKGKVVNLLDVPWESRDIARVLGAEWVDRINSYVYTGDLIPAELQPFKSKDYSYARWVEDEINGRIKAHEKVHGPMFSPRPHQQEAIDDIKNTIKKGWRAYIEADTTGLGKSISSLGGISEGALAKGYTRAKKAKTLIICPNNAIAHWRNTIRHLDLPHLRLMVINYEQYKKLLTIPASAANAKKAKTKNKHIASSGQPLIKWDFIIVDESQKIKNVTSQRSQAMQRIAQYDMPADKAPFCVYVSATIGQQPLELGYLAPLIGQAVKQPLTMDSWPQWLKDNNFNVQKSGSTWSWVKVDGPGDTINRQRQKQDVEKLANILFNPKAPSIRRKAEDIAGWPEQQLIAQPVALTDSSKLAYEKLWTEFRKELKLRPHGKNPSSTLAAQLRFSQKASLLRVPQTVEEIVDLLDNGQQVAVSVRFMESLDGIKRGLEKLGIAVSEFSGRLHVNNEKERLAFQKGVNKVILFSVEEAVSFHAKEQLPDGTTATPFPRATLVHDLRYSAISLTQIAGRAHRDGQKSNVYFLYAEGTVEERILNLMLNKMENMNSLMGESVDEAEGLVEVLDAILL